MVINEAILLGFNRSRQYFEGNIFAKGDVVSFAVEGILVDSQNDGGSISTSIASGLSGIYSGSMSTTNYNDSLGHLAGASRLIDGRTGGGVGSDEIIVNGTNYGRGRVLSISSPTNKDLTTSMTMAQRFMVEFEILEDLGALNFKVAGADENTGVMGSSAIYDSGYLGVEAVLEPYASRLETYNETFQFNYTENGGKAYEHNLDIKYRDIPGDPDAIHVAKTIASGIYSTRPMFGDLVSWEEYDAGYGGLSYSNVAIYNNANDNHNAYYSETFDNISKTCSFTKSWERLKEQNYPGNASPSPAGGGFASDELNSRINQLYGTGTKLGRTQPGAAYYSCQRVHQVNYSNGVATISEQAEIQPNQKYNMGAIYIGAESGGAYARCQQVLTEGGYDISAGNLSTSPVESTSFQNPVDNRFGYRLSFSDDPVYVSGSGEANNMASCYSVTREYSLSQTEDGIITVSSTHTAKPHLQSKLATTGEKLRGLDLINQGHDPTTFSPNYKPAWLAGQSLTEINRTYDIQDWGGQVTVVIQETDDQNITLDDSASAFAKKEVSVKVDHPVIEKETYLIAGCGEVLHASPQSSLGTIEITFEGTLKRDKSMNMLTEGLGTTWSTGGANHSLFNKNLNDILDEAYTDCSRYFASRIMTPTQLFITDTNYSWTSNRILTMTVELKYSKGALPQNLEIRR